MDYLDQSHDVFLIEEGEARARERALKCVLSLKHRRRPVFKALGARKPGKDVDRRFMQPVRKTERLLACAVREPVRVGDDANRRAAIFDKLKRGAEGCTCCRVDAQ